jgi:hypothetical protein
MPGNDRGANQQMRETVIPPQEQGGQLDTDYSVTCSSNEEAMERFRISAGRLLNVNEWDVLCGPVSARFEVTSPAGTPVNQRAHEGNFFRISIPAPGPVEGDGYDWVRIEEIEHRVDPALDEARMSMRVRPASNPSRDGSDVAHFFGPDATSTFRVMRKGMQVTASVHGRNETANDETSTLVDKVRNTVVALGARLGVSSIQWNSLVKGIIEGPPPADSGQARS